MKTLLSVVGLLSWIVGIGALALSSTMFGQICGAVFVLNGTTAIGFAALLERATVKAETSAGAPPTNADGERKYSAEGLPL